MSSGSVQLNRGFFNKQNLKDTNMHALSQDEKIGYTTMFKYLNEEGVDSFKGSVMYAIIIKGMGYTEEEAKDLKLGDVFEFVPNGES